jgi:hypothetical protein
LIVRVENISNETLTLQVDFHEEMRASTEEAELSIAFDILPSTDVTVPIHLKYLDSQNLFPSRTPGRLRMMVSGKPMQIEKVASVIIKSRSFYQERQIRVKDIYLSNEEIAAIHDPRTLVDEFGQWKLKDWQEKISNRQELNILLIEKLAEVEQAKDNLSSSQWSRFGGNLEKQLSKTGWFHTEKQDGKWWLVDPDGYAFFSSGIDCINPGADTRLDVMKPYIAETLQKLKVDVNQKKFDFIVNNLKEAFGEDNWWQSWAKIIKRYLQKWGINTIGNWSSLEFIKWANMPYVLPLDVFVKEGFPKTKQTIFRDFPDVFADEYTDKSLTYAKALEPFKDDPNLIGYFMRNEPEWGFVYGLNIAEEMLANAMPTASKSAFITYMEEKYKTIEAFNMAWRLTLSGFSDLLKPMLNAAALSEKSHRDLSDFSKVMIRRYVEIPAKACKEVDMNHMNLGMRYSYIASEMVLSGSENFDVLSINCYQETPLDKIAGVTNIIDKPVMIGEFHFGAIDKGLTATGIKGVTNQRERGVAYQYYMETAATDANFVGAHFFQLNDQSCMGRFDGENYQIGFLDCCLQEYDEMTEYVRQANENLFGVHNQQTLPTSKKAEQIPPIFC